MGSNDHLRTGEKNFFVSLQSAFKFYSHEAFKTDGRFPLSTSF